MKILDLIKVSILRIFSLQVKRKKIVTDFGVDSIISLSGTIRIKPDKDDAWFYLLSRKYNKIYDIGANIGCTALISRLNNPNGKILLVDPNQEALGLAAQNLIYNNWINHVEFYTYFVSDVSNKKQLFFTVGSGAAGSMFRGHAHTASKLNSFFEVPTISLDDLSEKVGWLPDFIKIDVEGAESNVLNGAVELTRKCQPVIMVEMHSPDELPMVVNAKRIIDWCEKVDYYAWYMAKQQKLTNPQEIAHRGKCHLLLLPKEAPYPNELIGIKEGSEIPIFNA